MNRTNNLSRLSTETFDICIIGGGASGAGCALDAALRGMKVALIEKNDFASETSSKSTKLIHGGVRYLEQAFKNFDFAQLKQVRHGLQERHIVIQNAPHLAHGLGLITPVFSWIEGLYFTIGLKIYGLFAKNDLLPKSKWLSKKETLAQMPTLSSKIHSSVLYYDGQLDDARYCLALAHTAQEAGATIANHLEVNGLEKDKSGKIVSVKTKDLLSGQGITIKAKLIINCTGPFADHIRLMANPTLEKRIRPSKGVHLMLPAEVLNSKDAMLIPKTKDGRVVFAIPFEGDLMLGTTDNDYDDLAKEPQLEAQEIDFLIETLQRYIQKPIDRNLVKGGFGGLRPLLSASANKDTKKLVRDHEVEHDETSGLISLMGGKWTTYRLMAKDTIDMAAAQLNQDQPCITENHLLVGAVGYNPIDCQHISDKYALPDDVAKHLVAKYGSRASKVADLTLSNPLLSSRLVAKYSFIEAEVIYHCQAEMACKIRDVLARRMRLEFLDWQAAAQAAPKVAEIMAQQLGWSSDQTTKELADYQLFIADLIARKKA